MDTTVLLTAISGDNSAYTAQCAPVLGRSLLNEACAGGAAPFQPRLRAHHDWLFDQVAARIKKHRATTSFRSLQQRAIDRSRVSLITFPFEILRPKKGSRLSGS